MDVQTSPVRSVPRMPRKRIASENAFLSLQPKKPKLIRNGSANKPLQETRPTLQRQSSGVMMDLDVLTLDASADATTSPSVLEPASMSSLSLKADAHIRQSLPCTKLDASIVENYGICHMYALTQLYK